MAIEHCTGDMVPSLTGAHGHNKIRGLARKSFEDVHQDFSGQSRPVVIRLPLQISFHNNRLLVMHFVILDFEQKRRRFRRRGRFHIDI